MQDINGSIETSATIAKGVILVFVYRQTQAFTGESKNCPKKMFKTPHLTTQYRDELLHLMEMVEE